MKKKFFLILVFMLCLSFVFGCAPQGEALTPGDLDDIIGGGGESGGGGGGTGGGESTITVNAYLVPGKGSTIGGEAGKDIASLYLENAYTVSGKIGAALPLPDAREKLEFVGWSESKDALANPIKKFVGRDKLILYGLWNYTGGGGSTEPPVPPVEADADFYLGINGAIDENTRFTVNKSNVLPDKEYTLTREFKLNDEFTFMSKAPLTPLAETTYPTSGDRGMTFGRDKVNAINSDDFFSPVDVAAGTGNSGVNTSGDFWAKMTSAKIKCKRAGKYTLYVVVYQGGWVKMFAMPISG